MTTIPSSAIYSQYADFVRNNTATSAPAANYQSASVFTQNQPVSSNSLMDQCKQMNNITNQLIRECQTAPVSLAPNQIQTTTQTNPFNQTAAVSNTSSSTPVNGTKEAPAGSYGGVPLSEEQTKNAKIIADVGKKMGASKRDIEIAIATAMQESQLKNLNYGDRDSQGLFQQRPSCGWGTVEQITTPEYAAGKFFEGLLKVKNRDSMSLTAAAQEVQRSGFPDAYAKWEGMAGDLSNKLTA
jgi:hypothetical protein